jgi:hypothetical protein
MRRSGNVGNDGKISAAAGEDGAISPDVTGKSQSTGAKAGGTDEADREPAANWEGSTVAEPTAWREEI